MNKRMIGYIVGKMMGVEAALLLLPALVAAVYGEHEGIYFLIPSGMLLVIFFLTGWKRPENRRMYEKEGLVIVALAWILWSVFGALPFTLSGEIPSYIDALFETVSGFTTTGSSILPNVEELSQCMIFWRSFTHWIGGMGVLVFVLVLTNLERQSTMYLMMAEVPGPEKGKLVPKMMSTARILYGIYLVMTVIMVFFLMFGGMSLFDSLIYSFGTAGTGGFANYSDSVGHFNSAYIDGVITVFMILFGINFNLYYLILLGDWRQALKNEEMRTYLFIIAAATAAVTINISSQFPSILKAFRYAIFQVSTIITTTGYATADYVQWPLFSQCILMLLMIIGACASSTGGGIKVSRVLVVLKSIKCEVKQMRHPKSVSIIRVNDKKMNPDVLRKVFVYLVAYATLFGISVLLISIDNKDFATTFSSVITTINNVGPGIAEVGPVGNFSEFSTFSKLVFCVDMLAGRLEIFPFMMLITSFAWRNKF